MAGSRSEVAEELDERVEQLLAPARDRVAAGLGEVSQAVRVREHPEAEEDHEHGEHALVHGGSVLSSRGRVHRFATTVTRVAGGTGDGAPPTLLPLLAP